MTVAVFTFVFLLGNLMNEILQLLVRGQASLGIVFEAMGLLIPFVMVFALPMALLTSTLLVFGRFSADQELTAARAGGISLLSLTTPIFLLSLFLCIISAWVNLDLAPRSRVAYKDLRDRALFKLEANLATALLPEDRFIRDFTNHIVYIGKNNGGHLENIMIQQLRDGTNSGIIRAARGEVVINSTNREAVLELFDVKGIRTEGGDDILGSSTRAIVPLTLGFGSDSKGPKKPRISDLTFAELRQELRNVENSVDRSAPMTNMSREKLLQRKAYLKKERTDLTSPIRVQMHRQIAFSFACFGFTLIGIPLGIRVHRRETNISFAIALVLVMVYYGFLLVANSLTSRPELSPHLIVWLPNFVFQAVGAVLLWRANRGV